MKKIVELPLIDPIYSTHHNGFFSALFVNNPTIKNWYLTNIMMLRCSRKFLSGFTSPQINVEGLSFHNNPYLEKENISMRFLKGYVKPIIRNLIDDGYYVYFTGVDDYYVEGKSYYGERHMLHDGGICGYNQEDKSFCLYAYDSNWVYKKFWVPQASFMKGIQSSMKQGKYGELYGLKPNTMQPIEFSAETALNNIISYLDSTYEKYPENASGIVYGIIVHNYIAKYISKLYDGSIPYEKMDWRTLRMIWEHKKVMLERIKLIESQLNLDNQISSLYIPLVAKANNARMLYASHHMRRRDELLLKIRDILDSLKIEEEFLLKSLLEKSRII